MNYDHWRHYARGWLFHFFGREDTAFEAYLTAFRINPQDVQSARHLAAIAAKRKNWDVAIKWFEAALALTPDDGANWFNLGYVCEHAGKTEGGHRRLHRGGAPGSRAGHGVVRHGAGPCASGSAR
jgi:tetratricopeptide (TPR) repeat protein